MYLRLRLVENNRCFRWRPGLNFLSFIPSAHRCFFRWQEEELVGETLSRGKCYFKAYSAQVNKLTEQSVAYQVVYEDKAIIFRPDH